MHKLLLALAALAESAQVYREKGQAIAAVLRRASALSETGDEAGIEELTREVERFLARRPTISDWRRLLAETAATGPIPVPKAVVEVLQGENPPENTPNS